MMTTYACRARGSVLRRYCVTRLNGWPVGRNGNMLVEYRGRKYVVPRRTLTVMWRDK